MCTVSFVPNSSSEFMLTSNRDEAKARGLASAPQIFLKQHAKIVAPIDPLASGSWIAASESGDVICLLNGAFKKHRHQPPYKKSRGLVVMDYFAFNDPEKFITEYSFVNIEPFTMVMVHQKDQPQLYELRWDGEQVYFQHLDSQQPHLWSSVTLYSDEIAESKRNQFNEALKKILHDHLSASTLIELHKQFLYEDWVKLPERIDLVSTLSITSVQSSNRNMVMYYCDLVKPDAGLVAVEL